MITLLETLIERADGAYANDRDLRSLEHVMSNWAERKAAYLAVQTKEKLIIDRAMTLMQENIPVRNHQNNNESMIAYCRRDLTLSLRQYALGMLLQDEEMLKDRFLYWQKNILQSMGLHHYQGVEFVWKSICIELPKAQANLFKPYFKLAQDTIVST